MKTMCCSDNAKDWGLLLLRLSVALIFIMSGWGKLSNMEMVITMFGGMGFPVPAFWAYLVAITEFLGGIAVLVGLYTRTVAALLAIIMLVALLVAHIPGPLQQAFLPIALLGSTIALSTIGAGKYRIMANQKECICPTKK